MYSLNYNLQQQYIRFLNWTLSHVQFKLQFTATIHSISKLDPVTCAVLTDILGECLVTFTKFHEMPECY